MASISGDIRQGNVLSVPTSGSLHQNVAAHVATQCLSSHILSGLCKIAGYEVLRHGTSWSNYVSIVRNGADVRKGGETTDQVDDKYTISCVSTNLPDGSVKITEKRERRTEPSEMVLRAKNHFYVFRDSKLGVRADGTRALNWFLSMIGRRIGAIMHSFLAYVGQEKKACDEEISFAKHCIAFRKALFTPKLKFIYSLDEIEGAEGKEGIFEKDPDYGEESAYRTSQNLPSDRIGIMGFFAHTNAAHFFKHLRSNPGRVCQGIMQLAAGILLTAIPGLGVIT
jgi:hypothetical protein